MNPDIWPQSQYAPLHCLLSRSLVSLEGTSKHTPFGAKSRRVASTVELVSGLRGRRVGDDGHLSRAVRATRAGHRWLCPPHPWAVLSPPACPQEQRAGVGVGTRDVPSPGVLSTTLILFSVETKVFSGSGERRREARVTVSAPPVGREPRGDPLAAGLSSPSGDLPGPAAPQRRSLLEPGAPSPGFLCPFRDAHACPREHGGVPAEGASPRGEGRGRQGRTSAPRLPGPDARTPTSRRCPLAAVPADEQGRQLSAVASTFRA